MHQNAFILKQYAQFYFWNHTYFCFLSLDLELYKLIGNNLFKLTKSLSFKIFDFISMLSILPLSMIIVKHFDFNTFT